MIEIPVFREAPFIKQNQLFIAAKSSVEGRSKATLKPVDSTIPMLDLLEAADQILNTIYTADMIGIEKSDITVAMAADKMQEKIKELIEYVKENQTQVPAQ